MEKIAGRNNKHRVHVAKMRIALADAHSGRGFSFETRRQKNARSPKKKGEYSRGWFVDVYGDRLSHEQENNPDEMKFVVAYVHPCKGRTNYVY